MKKKITVVDKTFTPIVVLADANSAIYEDRGQRPGEQNLLSETVITCTAMDGTKKVATMKASILQVPTKFMPAATTSAPGIPAKQLAINYLCDKSAEVDERYDREKNDNIAMILPVTTHLYIDSLEVEEPYRNRGIATAMLDFIISMAVPESICLFAAKEDAEMQRMTMLKDNDANKTNIPSIGSAFSVGGDAQADTSFSKQAAVSPVTAITSNGRNWKLNASNVLIQGEDGSQAAVAVDAPDAFQYDGKSLSFELDGATYIVRMVSDTYEGGVQYAKEVTSETVTVSGMRSVGNGQVLVVVGTRPASDAQDVNDAVQTVVSSVLESAAPASDVGVVTFNGVSVSADGYDVSFSNSEAVLKAGDSEVKFTPSSYQADAIEFGDAGTSASGAAVTHGDYADANGTEAYLIESDDGNVMAFTNSSDMLTAVLGLQ